MTAEIHPPPASPRRGPRADLIALGLITFTVAYITLFLAGGEARDFALAGVEAIPFAALALLTYAGVRSRGARLLAWAMLALITGGIALLSVSSAYDVLAGDGGLDAAGRRELALVVVLVLAGLAIGWAFLSERPRRTLARLLPIDPASFVHEVALIAVLSITLVSFVPVVVLQEPPLLAGDTSSGEGSSRDDLYALAWLLPATAIAAGYPIARGLRAAFVRLGLVRPTFGQVLIGLAGGAAMVLIFIGVDNAIGRVWETFGWPTTDSESFDELMAYTFTPLGALIVGVTAGLGEEAAVRGVLQPRLGILLSNLFFTSLHAFQYNVDGLLSVFLAGLVLGWVRARTNTTTSAIMHGVYDFLLIMLVVISD